MEHFNCKPNKAYILGRRCKRLMKYHVPGDWMDVLLAVYFNISTDKVSYKYTNRGMVYRNGHEDSVHCFEVELKNRKKEEVYFLDTVTGWVVNL
jgi:hypothetical protein